MSKMDYVSLTATQKALIRDDLKSHFGLSDDRTVTVRAVKAGPAAYKDFNGDRKIGSGIQYDYNSKYGIVHVCIGG